MAKVCLRPVLSDKPLRGSRYTFVHPCVLSDYLMMEANDPENYSTHVDKHDMSLYIANILFERQLIFDDMEL